LECPFFRLVIIHSFQKKFPFFREGISEGMKNRGIARLS
jgi:hypothetical protein